MLDRDPVSGALRCQGTRMNAVRINLSPFKGEVGRGIGLSGGYFVDQTAVRALSLPLKGLPYAHIANTPSSRRRPGSSGCSESLDSGFRRNDEQVMCIR